MLLAGDIGGTKTDLAVYSSETGPHAPLAETDVHSADYGSLPANDLYTLNAGAPVPSGAIGVVAPGTGLGESFLTWDGSRYIAHSSEGGHASYAPSDETQIGLLAYMLKRFDHVSYEQVCSGIGIPHIYEYLRSSGYAPETPEVAEAIAAAREPSPAIIKYGLDPSHTSALCATTLDILVSILGDEAGNLALKVLATGGVYLAGGITTHILPALKEQRFMQSFTRKGRFAELMARMPIHVIVTRAALAGAAGYGLENLIDGPDRG